MVTQKSRKSQKNRFALLCAARAKGTFCDFREFCVTSKISFISFISAGLKKHSFFWLYAEFFVSLH